MNPKIECYDEIVSAESAWKEAVQVTLQQRPAIDAFFEAARPSEIFFVGCTSPYYASTSAAAFWKAETGLPARAFPSSELALFPEIYYSGPASKPVLITLSRSGKTTETIWAVEGFERRYPGRTVLIGCNPQGPLAEMASLKILLPISAEKSIPQTRSWGSFYISALMMAAFRSGNQAAIATMQSAPSKAEAIIQNCEATLKALFAGKQFDNAFVLGSGYLFGIAREGEVKLQEMSTTQTAAYPFLETRHGPRSVIDEHSLVIGLYSQAGLHYEAQLMEELTTIHKATTVAITPRRGWETGKVSESIGVDCDWPDGIIGLAYLPVIQLAAYYCAISKGQNPDLARFHSHFVEIKRF